MIIEGLIKAKNNFKTENEEHTVLEFGVFTGDSYIKLANFIHLNYPGTSLIGFDSWQGLPQETTGIWYPNRHEAGFFRASKNNVLDRLSLYGLDSYNNYRLIDGFYEDSLTSELQSQIKNIIFVNIDVDLYKSTAELLEFIYPLLRKGVILYFDDWKAPDISYPGMWGEHLAWFAFIEKYPHIKYETIKINENNQRLIEITEI